jgi:biopolymer transport protein ExbD
MMPFAALFLTLIALTVGVHTPAGFAITIARAEPCGYDDRRTVVVQVLSHGGLRINVEDLKREDLERRLEEIFRTRAVRHTYLTSDPDVSFEEVAQVIDSAAKHVAYISIISPSVLNQVKWPHDSCLVATLPETYLAHPLPH